MAMETLEYRKSDRHPSLSEESKAAEMEETKLDKHTGIPEKEKNAEHEKAEEQTNKATEKYEKNEQGEEHEEEDEEFEATEKVKAKSCHKENAKEGQSETSHNRAGNDPVTPGSDRPTRVRKTVERYSEPSPPKSAKSFSSKALLIEKGRGTQLKDIPNVAFKLTKRKPDDNLQVLHSILFGKKVKAHSLKRNIGQFSGYVWVENEEKQRAKVKEKIDKCVKEKLVDFCDVLNIPINKTTVKKEELSAKLLEFLESPHATTDALLSDKNQKGQKLKRKAMPSKSSGDSSMESATKKKTRISHVGKKEKHSSRVKDEDDQVEPADAKDDSQDDDSGSNEEVDQKESKFEEKEDSQEEKEDEKPKTDKSVSKKKAMEDSKSDGITPVKKASVSKAVKKAEKTPKGSTSKKNASYYDTPISKSNKSASSKQKTEKEKWESKVRATTKKADKSLAKASAKDLALLGKAKSSKKAKLEPSRSELHAVVVDILKEVDFNTATLSDILRQLGTHFGLDLMHRKAEVKDIITDVINNMSDEDEGEEDEDVRNSDDADKDDDSDG